MTLTNTRLGNALLFGPFTLIPKERLLTKQGAPVVLGARALDTLIALVTRPNEVVSKDDLLAQIWPDVIVEEGSLRFHIAGLRKALGDGKDGARYITTLAGRGYCFVAPLTRSNELDNVRLPTTNFSRANLPNRLIRMIGRTDDVAAITVKLMEQRFVAIVGPGGVGKTTVAVTAADCLQESFDGAVVFVDLGTLRDPSLVAQTLASMLGLSVPSDDPIPGIIAYLRDMRLLVVLDNCEHLIEAASALATRIFVAARQVHILATSRESLRVEGEHVYKLEPLTFPPDDAGLTTEVAMTFTATQLFVERAKASGARLDLNDAEAAIVSRICRQLDGVALAIELAAGRVGAYGLEQTAELLDKRLNRLWPGQRTAPPRQKTLQATLDWSYGLLTEPERLTLRKLAVFVGQFTIEAALAVVTSATMDEALSFETIDSLVAKSMVATRPVGAMMRYRLLDTTRAYALEINVDAAELAHLGERHASYCRQWLEQTNAQWKTPVTASERERLLTGLGDVRAGLDWCFGANGSVKIGVGLAASAAPVFLGLALFNECHRWTERAIQTLDHTNSDGRDEMLLQSALGMSLMFTCGMIEPARVALSRGLAIAEQRGDALNQLQLLGTMHMFKHRSGNFKTALNYAQRMTTVSETIAEPDAVGFANTFLGISLDYVGNLNEARLALESVVRRRGITAPASKILLGFDHHNLAGSYLARTLWLQGRPEQALERARCTVGDAARTELPATLCIALIWASSVFIWTGNFQTAEKHIDWLISHAEVHSLAPFLEVGRGLKCELSLRRGSTGGEVQGLQSCLVKLRAVRHELQTTAFSIAIVQGLAASSRLTEAFFLIDETIKSVSANGDHSFMPELFRVKGNLFLKLQKAECHDAAKSFKQSIDLSRVQCAPSWELRAAVDLANLLASQGRKAQGRKLLQTAFEQFEEGFETADLKVAARLLAELG